ncbi:hypothetical protein QCA50_012352 [Cerrena zonata]|uniref:Uncharacterized protein n=1 Tax=Cerrena zonata TaxID=2478898 RepID=A0AAW0FSU8_9APHY
MLGQFDRVVNLAFPNSLSGNNLLKTVEPSTVNIVKHQYSLINMGRYGTRQTNATKHPGLVDIDTTRKKRRSDEEMEQVRLEQEAAVQALEDKNAELLNSVARLEARSRELEQQSLAPSVPPIPKAASVNTKTAKNSKGSVKSKTKGTVPGPPEPIEAELAHDSASQAQGKGRKKPAKPRRTDVAKVVVEGKDSQVVDEDTRKRKLPTDSSVTSSRTKKTKPTTPSGLLTSYKSHSHAGGTTAASSPDVLDVTDTNIKYGGFAGSDSESEIEFVEETGTGSRNTASTTVKIEINDSSLRLSETPGPSGAKRGTKAKSSVKDIYDVLPSHCHYVFTELYVPELLYFIGNRISPWITAGVNWTETFKTILESALPNGVMVPPTDPESAVARVSNQRVAEWKHGMSKQALDIIAKKITIEGFDEDDTAEFVAQQLKPGLPFISLTTTYYPVSRSIVRDRRFQGPLLLETFAYHLGRVGKSADEYRDTPDAALGLACVAMERALGKYKTGTQQILTDKSGAFIDSFSHQVWGYKTDQYSKSIRNLTETEWAAILEGAEAYLVQGGSSGRGHDGNEGSSAFDFEDDERANI